ncbi:hypothetical protein NJC38_14375 [Pseudomonas sp. 21LCFQ010]|uniref:hypothetical protein n=1 Tax=Pseudomonas sp. 21LCFQ010 TaxID=2957506 RepID=UPI0020979DCC|nr:hypothetical protein [Pseudomonas sp. 21LCFQ010]MCO8163345.1 hypothetical protein [Pseudomonas sp. 21LCFQ010]
MKRIKSVALSGAMIFSLFCHNIWAANAQSWNLARDMYLMTEKSPAGSPWAFMQNKTAVNAAANYTLFPTLHADQCGDGATTCWMEGAGNGYIAIVKKSWTFSGSGSSSLFKQGDVVAHPGSNFQSIVRWTSPIAGNINVLGRINDLHNACGDGISWSLNLGDTLLQSGSLAKGGSSLIHVDNIAVTVAAALYLVIDKKANYSCDATSFDPLRKLRTRCPSAGNRRLEDAEKPDFQPLIIG